MKIKISITREFDTGDDQVELFEGVENKTQHALNLFAEDIDYLVKYNEVKDQAIVEVIE